MDKLEEIFKLQGQLDEMVGFAKFTDQEAINNNFMSIIHELCEIHDETNWKHWKKTKKEEDKDKILEEFADILHFIVQLAIRHNFNARQVYEAYVKKNIINRERVKNNY